jgi:hypothetical protein
LPRFSTFSSVLGESVVDNRSIINVSCFKILEDLDNVGSFLHLLDFCVAANLSFFFKTLKKEKMMKKRILGHREERGETKGTELCRSLFFFLLLLFCSTGS